MESRVIDRPLGRRPFRPDSVRGAQRTVLAAFCAAVVLLVALAVPLQFGRLSVVHVRDVDDLAQLGCAVLSAALAVVAHRRAAPALRRSWLLIAIGTGAWALGQLAWCYYELIAQREAPFPSIADAGYLVFPVAAMAALWFFPNSASRGARHREVLDSAVIVLAVITVSWVTSLGAVTHAGASSTFAFAVSLAYPIGDILLTSLAVFMLTRESAHRGQLLLLAIGMTAMAFADSRFVYLTATDTYRTGDVGDLGWCAAFLLLAVAAVTAIVSAGPARAAERATAPAVHPAGRDTTGAAANPEPSGAPTRFATAPMLPYLPLAIAIGVLAVRRVQGHGAGVIQSLAVLTAVGVVLLRQYLTLRENRDLVRGIAAREAQLHTQAFYDQLTGLANRALFMDRATHALDLHARDLRQLAVLFCDLDDFKAVNDNLGHGVGDELLVRVAERLSGIVRPGDTLARLGGDEFALLIEDGGEAVVLADRLVSALRVPFALADTRLAVHASVGIAEVRSHDVTPALDVLLSRADIAMYAAKRAGKSQLAVYHSSMVTPESSDLALRQPLTQAIAERRITVQYQPIVTMEDGHILGLEALARWENDGVHLPPDRFIPVANRAGVLHDLTHQVLEQACEQLAHWTQVTGNRRLRVGVNVPPSLVTDRDFPDRLARIINRNGLANEQLVLEITEDALLQDLETAREVTYRVRGMGARLSLDDFGTGYSSLLHLQRIPLDSLKIDRGFVTDIDRDPSAVKLVAGILSLAQTLDLLVVAEGIERTAQADVLRDLGCPLAQGFLYSPPRPGAEIVDLLRAEAERRASTPTTGPTDPPADPAPGQASTDASSKAPSR